MSAAGKFMFTHMRKKNDIVAAAMLGLVQAVTWAETRLYDDEITPYIYETVCRHIQDFLEEDWVITMPGSTHRLSVRTADKENDPNLIVKPPRTITLPNDEGNTNIYRRLSTHAVSETAEAMVFEDFCLHSHLTDVEKAVLHLLLESYTIDEMVGKVIGERGKPVSRIRIYQIVDGIKNKVHLER
jgi:DNA-directed RNA polymerase specialized sigma subunit